MAALAYSAKTSTVAKKAKVLPPLANVVQGGGSIIGSSLIVKTPRKPA